MKVRKFPHSHFRFLSFALAFFESPAGFPAATSSRTGLSSTPSVTSEIGSGTSISASASLLRIAASRRSSRSVMRSASSFDASCIKARLTVL
jgi:hypothetical protein